MVAIVALLFLIFAYAALRFPPAFLALTMVLTGHGDARGVAGFLSGMGLGQLEILTAGLVPLAVLKSYVRVLKDRSYADADHRRLRVIATTLVLFIVWNALATGLKTSHIPSAVYAFAQLQVYAALVALAYWPDSRARTVFYGVLLWQLLLSATILLAPSSPLAMLSSLKYQDSYIETDYSIGIARITEETSRQFGQFYNTNQYGFYSVAGLAFGGILLLCRSAKSILVGLVVLGLSLFGWTVTFTRGATAGLAAGVLMMGVVLLASARRRSLGPMLMGTVAVMALAAIVWPAETPSLFKPFLVDAKYDDGLRYRRAAVEFSLEVLEDSPVLGYEDLSQVGGAQGRQHPSPHQTMLYVLVRYGMVSAFCSMALMYWGVAGWPWLWLQLRHRDSPHTLGVRFTSLCLILGFVCMGVHFTNAAAGGCLNWIAIGIACLPWAIREGSGFPGIASRKLKSGVEEDVRVATLPWKEGSVIRGGLGTTTAMASHSVPGSS